MTTPANTPTTDSDSEIDSSSSKPTQNPNASPNFIDPLIANPSRAPVVCLFRFAGDASAGAIMGSIFGLGSGFVKRKGFKGALGEASVNAKMFAVLSGVHSLVVCLLKRLRGKDDVINAGVAGCCTGLALSFPGAPQALLQSCVTFGAFSCIIEGFNKQQPALAISQPTKKKKIRSVQAPFLPPLAFPLPNDLKESFSAFCQSIGKRRTPAV